MKYFIQFLALGFVLGIAPYGWADERKEAQESGMPMRQLASLEAMLIQPEIKAREGIATIEVSVKDISLVDPAQVGEKPREGEGHLHYRVDHGPLIATTTKKLSFHALSPGKHTITVMLAGNDHKVLGPQKTLNVTVP